MKKVLGIILAVALLIAVAGCGASETKNPAGSGDSDNKPEAPEVITLRVACQEPDSHVTVQAMQRIKKKVEEQTNGGLVLDLYTSGSLGDYTATFEELMLGSIDISFQSLTGEYDPRLELTFIPYLFKNSAEAKKVCVPGSNTYALFEEILGDLDIQLLGIYGLGFVGVGTNVLDPAYADPSVPKTSVIRSNTADSNVLSVKAMGYPNITLTRAETYGALQTGVMDGTFGNAPQQIHDSFRDVVKYYIYYKTIAENNEIMINKETYEKLPADYQKILSDACLEECIASFDEAEENDAMYMKKLEEYGIEVITLTEEELKTVSDAIKVAVWPVMEEQMTSEVMDVVRADAGL